MADMKMTGQLKVQFRVTVVDYNRRYVTLEVEGVPGRHCVCKGSWLDVQKEFTIWPAADEDRRDAESFRKLKGIVGELK